MAFIGRFGSSKFVRNASLTGVKLGVRSSKSSEESEFNSKFRVDNNGSLPAGGKSTVVSLGRPRPIFADNPRWIALRELQKHAVSCTVSYHSGDYIVGWRTPQKSSALCEMPTRDDARSLLVGTR